MTEIATNIKTEIGKNQDAENDTRNIQAQFIEADDVQEVEQMQLAGFESNPPVGTKHLTVNLGGGWKQSFAENDGVAPDATLEPGESKVYSSDGGTVKAFIILRKDGTIELNGTGDFAVRFNELQTGFDKLKDDVNSQISTFDAHIHDTTATVGTGPPGVISPTTTTGTPSTADISAAKIDTIKVPA